MKTIAVQMLASLALLAGCGTSHTEGNSSGSNWLRCRTLADCRGGSAETCSSDGYCTDSAGARIEAGRSTPKPSGNDPKGMSPRCANGVDEALAKVGVVAPERESCGGFGPNLTTESWRAKAGALACFERLQQTSTSGVEVSADVCADCNRPTTFLATPDGEFYAVERDESGAMAEGERDISVQACSSIRLADDKSDFECADARSLYACSEPALAVPPFLPARPVTPYKIMDPYGPDSVARVPVHLYVRNRSINFPIEIRVSFDALDVVLGSFATGSSWQQFDLEVPAGPHDLGASASNLSTPINGRAEVMESLGGIYAERWLTLEYSYTSLTNASTLTLGQYDTPVNLETD